MSVHHRLVAAGVLLVFAACAQARGFQGTVTHVTDGDSLWVRPASGGAPIELRLQGIDAPEICQASGRLSRDALAALVLRRPVAVRTRARDTYQRTLARVSIDGQDVGAWMVERGYAWSYRFRGRGGPYEEQQARARDARLGLWSEARAIEPRQFRKSHGSCR
jgi:endonuclease YncB( thermonuclease family)